MSHDELEPIAIIGLAGRFPGADSVAAFWDNMCAGVESVTWFAADELLAAGVEPGQVRDPDYVPAAAVVEGADRFDAAFFGFTPREADMTDPQHRMFLECAWEAFEDAGHARGEVGGPVGVFAGCFMNKYLATNLQANAAFRGSPHALVARVFNDKDFLATRASYALDLRGPAYTVQSACSSGLVAVHIACQALWAYECDAALAGGVCLNVPLITGYPMIDGGMFTPAGQCRPFDARASGTVPGYGAGVVVVRRLADAIADRDNIRAIIRGTAVNNDGSLKAGFTAPSVAAQAEVVAAAQAIAGVGPDTIGYVEAHGTATLVGDPIEVAALTQAFRAGTDRRGFCALGSVKANIGHLDAAAGTVGLMRAVLALEHGLIPPSINFDSPSPELKLDDGPFFVPDTAMAWPETGRPRRAGVSSLGAGGTNAHVVLEQAPDPQPPGPARRDQLLVLSAHSRAALDAAGRRLAAHLESHPDLRMADVAYTLQAGRHAFAHRRFLVCRDTADAVAVLRGGGPHRTTAIAPEALTQPVFMFPGGDAHSPDVGLEIYVTEELFRTEIDRCADLLRPLLGSDLRHVLFPSLFGDRADPGDVRHVLAGSFVVEYALARLWQSWGIEPTAMIGYSLGEYVAACLAGVFSLPDALELTVARGEILARTTHGRMLVVPLGEDEIGAQLGEHVSLAAVNAPALSLVSGPADAVDDLGDRMARRGIECRPIDIRLASHSWLVEPHIPEFHERISRLRFAPPQVPFLSCVTGTWIDSEQATDPAYWAEHLRRPVRFADMVREATAAPGRVLLEVGPGNSLTALADLQRIAPRPVTVPSMGHQMEPGSEMAYLLSSLGRLWTAGVRPDWAELHGAAWPRRIPLPTYPFERRRHWIEPDRLGDMTAAPGRVADGETPGAANGQSPGTRSADGNPDSIAALPPDDAAGYVPPGTELERMLAALWSDVLGIEPVSIEDDFFSLGGNSLMLTQVQMWLRRTLTLTLTTRDMFAAPTVSELAALIEARRTPGSAAAPAEQVALADEAVLDPAIDASGLPEAASGLPRAVLLTGVTGFLGAFLAGELLARTSAVIYCLVRTRDAAAGLARVRTRLEECALWPGDSQRLVAVPGDLSQPLLGLPPAEFDALAEKVDALYHCGAWVNFVRPYRTLKAANVGGSHEMLRLATRRRLKPVHHVSTLAVLAGALTSGVSEVFEDAELPPPVGHDTAYSQSKWVVERLVAMARERGVPVSVYRPGIVLADGRSGSANAEDYLTKMIQGCVQLGLAPLRNYDLSVGTADYVAQAIVALSLDGRRTANGTYHVVDPEPLPWNRIFRAVRRFGYPVRTVPYDTWYLELVSATERGEPNVLEPLVGSLAVPGDRHMPRIDCRNVRDGTPITPPPLDDRYFAAMLRYFIRCGWLPPLTLP